MLSPENVRSIRPGFGLPPAHRDEVMGCRAVGPIKRGTPISLGADRQELMSDVACAGDILRC